MEENKHDPIQEIHGIPGFIEISIDALPYTINTGCIQSIHPVGIKAEITLLDETVLKTDQSYEEVLTLLSLAQL